MERVSLNNKEENEIVGVLSQNNGSQIIFVLCHGFMASMETGFMPEVFGSLVEQDYNVFTFDFSGNGGSEGEIGDSSYVKEKEDLDSVLDFLEDKGYEEFCLISHSMGGGVSILKAAEDARIRWLIDIAAPAHHEKIKERVFDEEKVEEAMKKGKTRLSIYGKKVSFNKKFFEDLEKINILEAASNISIPTLIIHGSEDKTIPLEESGEILQKLKGENSLQIIAGANHRFKGKEYELVDKLLEWISRCVK